jgi:hypothetical protein
VERGADLFSFNPLAVSLRVKVAITIPFGGGLVEIDGTLVEQRPERAQKTRSNPLSA